LAIHRVIAAWNFPTTYVLAARGQLQIDRCVRTKLRELSAHSLRVNKFTRLKLSAYLIAVGVIAVGSVEGSKGILELQICQHRLTAQGIQWVLLAISVKATMFSMVMAFLSTANISSFCKREKMRLTVSIVRPRKLPMSVRDIGKLKRSEE